MPNLSKKKGGRRFNPQLELNKAEKVLAKHKSAKFLNKQKDAGQAWKFNHLTPNEAMHDSDQWFNKKVLSISKSRNLDEVNRNPYLTSQHNEDRSLQRFEDDAMQRHQLRSVHDDSDIDPSDTELADDERALNMVSEHDDIFAYRKRNRNRNGDDGEDEDNEEVLESSGDDLDMAEDDNLLAQQKDDEDDDDEDLVDIDEQQVMHEQAQPVQPEEEEDVNVEVVRKQPTQKKKKKKQKKKKVSDREIEHQIMHYADADDDADIETRKRLLRISKKLNDDGGNDNDGDTRKHKPSTDRALYDDSDASSYYHSSDDDGGGIEHVHDMERIRSALDASDEEDDADADAPDAGIGDVYWGRHRGQYYGADAAAQKRSQSQSHSRGDDQEEYRALRDEEAIAMQMQKDELKRHKQAHFMDEEMQQLMRQQMQKQERVEKRKQQKQKQKQKTSKTSVETVESGPQAIAQKFSAWFNDDDENAAENVEFSEQVENSNTNKVADEECNIERIEKETDIVAHTKLIQRDHPEIPGMLSELRQVVDELRDVYRHRQRAIQKRFDDAIEDCTLFVELLRTYASTMSFYLALKVKKTDNQQMKKHGIFNTLLKLKQRVNSFRSVYRKSIDLLSHLPLDWNRDEYLKQKRELFEYEKERQSELHEQRVLLERQRLKQAHIERKKLKKTKTKEEKLKRKLFKQGFHRLRNEDTKLDGDDARRAITNKIFKSQGLHRYRTPGIPRVKARTKYLKKMKLWKQKGFKEYKGKLPNGRMEWNIDNRMTHSKRLS